MSREAMWLWLCPQLECHGRRSAFNDDPDANIRLYKVVHALLFVCWSWGETSLLRKNPRISKKTIHPSSVSLSEDSDSTCTQNPRETCFFNVRGDVHKAIIQLPSKPPQRAITNRTSDSVIEDESDSYCSCTAQYTDTMSSHETSCKQHNGVNALIASTQGIHQGLVQKYFQYSTSSTIHAFVLILNVFACKRFRQHAKVHHVTSI